MSVRRFALGVLFAVLLLCVPAQAATPLEQRVFDATVAIFTKDANGQPDRSCTASAISRKDNKYLFVTAAHCVLIWDANGNLTGQPVSALYLTPDTNEPWVVPAHVLLFQYDNQGGHDWGVIEAMIPVVMPLLEIGPPPLLGDEVLVVGFPAFFTKQLSQGIVSTPHVAAQGLSGYGALNLYGIAGGSSGSAVVNVRTGRICGLIVLLVEQNFPVFQSFVSLDGKELPGAN
jgi:hypothetical protein